MEALYNILLLLWVISILLGIIGLINPKIFSKILGKKANRKFIALLSIGTFLGITILAGIVEPQSLKQEQLAKKEIQNVQQQKTELENITEQKVDPRYYWHEVTAVVDGDTLKARIDGKEETIRIIGIDAPESTNSNECYGSESSNRAKELLAGKWIQAEADSSQSDRDKYSRLLRFVWLGDNTDFGKKMISDGYAYEYTYNTPYKYHNEYKNAEKSAKEKPAGLWTTDTCAGQRTKLQPTVQNSVSETAQTTAPVTTPSTSNVYYSNCTAARNAGAAPIYANEPGYRAALDRDKDGVACE